MAIMILRSWRWPLILTVISLAIVTTLSPHIALSQRPIFPINHDAHSPSSTRVFATSAGDIHASRACLTSPPSPALSPDTQDRFNWRAIPSHHPVDQYARLPSDRPSPGRPAVQHSFGAASRDAGNENASRQRAVKDAFERCWKSYKDRAWAKDELAPVSGGARSTFGGWGATLVDSLDTLWIMGMKDEYAEAVDAAIDIDFRPSDDGEMNMFEIIIRYLGGFIGAYDVSGCHDARLLNKAIEVADMAYASFDTPNRMPVSRWSLRKAADGEEQLPAQSVLIAEAASASVEFTRLSQITGDMRYFDAISRVTEVLDDQQGLTKLPGMWPITVDMRTPNLTLDSFFGLGAMADSAYEYLPKMHQLLNGVGSEAAQYRKMYEYAMTTAITHTVFRPMVEDKADILIAGANVDGERNDKGQHLVCFAGGMLALGGRLFGNGTHIDIGRRLSDGCAWTYKHAPNGIMPEVFSMTACPTWAECDYTSQSGPGPFSNVDDGRYVLRPEAIESIFYMFRITGERKYQDIAWNMFQAIDAHTRTEFGNAALADVMETPTEKYDSMESFWLAETLKYFYLIFSNPETISLDDFVLNTEAHPFRIPYR
ncbi:glycoside hydrolase family 47 protein [Lentithecium fluviatile CBS 122367]|uniref:alpha-1,2-Mannosidase n=1 Tax=Lentithecium fluviatile CBS 122367 TaxID=1168545 RepID=A0A6G1IUT3_9PLEO|nr:glycoside hydrolase family 47 protein [Lentithecium fluviatile CBS 122367]